MSPLHSSKMANSTHLSIICLRIKGFAIFKINKFEFLLCLEMIDCNLWSVFEQHATIEYVFSRLVYVKYFILLAVENQKPLSKTLDNLFECQ